MRQSNTHIDAKAYETIAKGLMTEDRIANVIDTPQASRIIADCIYASVDTGTGYIPENKGAAMNHRRSHAAPQKNINIRLVRMFLENAQTAENSKVGYTAAGVTLCRIRS
eukprot:GHVO01052203.1.p2 GENE.GHVO01052203.1~~GHVO01052203.1.p2  ORF type:complete len:110 (-),score=24.27 GHVO01052203.1:152-481(-)